MMTKAQFVEALKADLPDVFQTKAAADKAFDAFCRIMAREITSKNGVRLPKVGTFAVTKRSARTGRNPQTGEKIKIPAKQVVKFSTAKSLGEALNK